jgi:AraC-like DNA-binding protein
MSKYYAVMGDVNKSIAYADSAAVQHANYQKQYNDAHIFNVEKKLYDAEKKVKEEQLTAEKTEKEKYRNLLIMVLLIIMLSACFYFLYDRLVKRKNRALYKRYLEEARIQDELTKARRIIHTPENQSNHPETTDPENNGKTGGNDLLQRLEDLMLTERLFTKPEINRKKIAQRLLTNETYLIYAIQEAHNGKSFSEYINMLRLKHACHLLQNDAEQSIKDIYALSGFVTYKYFHQLFREEFGMSPSDFR